MKHTVENPRRVGTEGKCLVWDGAAEQEQNTAAATGEICTILKKNETQTTAFEDTQGELGHLHMGMGTGDGFTDNERCKRRWIINGSKFWVDNSP